MTKPSPEVLKLARELIRLSSTDWSESDADAFLDNLNPSIRRSLLLEGLKPLGTRLMSTQTDLKQKITVIKCIRQATGWGLKEAKEFVELANGDISVTVINGTVFRDAVLPTLSIYALNILERDLQDTGFYLGH